MTESSNWKKWKIPIKDNKKKLPDPINRYMYAVFKSK